MCGFTVCQCPQDPPQSRFQGFRAKNSAPAVLKTRPAASGWNCVRNSRCIRILNKFPPGFPADPGARAGPGSGIASELCPIYWKNRGFPYRWGRISHSSPKLQWEKAAWLAVLRVLDARCGFYQTFVGFVENHP